MCARVHFCCYGMYMLSVHLYFYFFHIFTFLFTKQTCIFTSWMWRMVSTKLKSCWFKKLNGLNASLFFDLQFCYHRLCQYVLVVWLFISVDIMFILLHGVWGWSCLFFAFNLKMCKKTSSWCTKTSFNNKVNVRQLYHLWVCHFLPGICYQFKWFHNLGKKSAVFTIIKVTCDVHTESVNRLVDWQKTNSFLYLGNCLARKMPVLVFKVSLGFGLLIGQMKHFFFGCRKLWQLFETNCLITNNENIK